MKPLFSTLISILLLMTALSMSYAAVRRAHPGIGSGKLTNNSYGFDSISLQNAPTGSGLQLTLSGKHSCQLDVALSQHDNVKGHSTNFNKTAEYYSYSVRCSDPQTHLNSVHLTLFRTKGKIRGTLQVYDVIGGKKSKSGILFSTDIHIVDFKFS